jgi:hypothetical protein
VISGPVPVPRPRAVARRRLRSSCRTTHIRTGDHRLAETDVVCNRHGVRGGRRSRPVLPSRSVLAITVFPSRSTCRWAAGERRLDRGRDLLARSRDVDQGGSQRHASMSRSMWPWRGTRGHRPGNRPRSWRLVHLVCVASMSVVEALPWSTRTVAVASISVGGVLRAVLTPRWLGCMRAAGGPSRGVRRPRALQLDRAREEAKPRAARTNPR